MATQKEVKNRIASIKNINKITRAMEMVAAARLRRAEQRIGQLRPYAQGMRKLTRRAAEQAGGIPRVPVLVEREQVQPGRRRPDHRRPRPGRRLQHEHHPRRHAAEDELARAGGRDVVLGGRAARASPPSTFRKQDLRTSYVGFTDRPGFANAREIGEELTARYVDGELDRVELVYNHYVSPLTQHVWRQTLLPLQQADVIGEGVDGRGRGGRGDRDRESPQPGALGL